MINSSAPQDSSASSAAPATTLSQLHSTLQLQTHDIVNQYFTYNAGEAFKKIWRELNENGECSSSGTDATNRCHFVNVQAVMEESLSIALESGMVVASVAVIHTPCPSTPLRTDAAAVSPGVIHADIIKDPKRLATITDRITTLRDYLNAGGILITAYPESGLRKKNPQTGSEEHIDGLGIFEKWKEEYPINLIDSPLKSLSSCPQEYSGATYIYQEKDGPVRCFAIKATQAHDPKDEKKIWCDVLRLQEVDTLSDLTSTEQRFKFINDFLKIHGIDLVEHCSAAKEQPIRCAGMPLNAGDVASSMVEEYAHMPATGINEASASKNTGRSCVIS